MHNGAQWSTMTMLNVCVCVCVCVARWAAETCLLRQIHSHTSEFQSDQRFRGAEFPRGVPHRRHHVSHLTTGCHQPLPTMQCGYTAFIDTVTNESILSTSKYQNTTKTTYI